ncbi:MAG: translational GTPase TypA [Trueperaceae bacterium]|nr:translational GTPase TypA [Trueperaceae bacterium]
MSYRNVAIVAHVDHGKTTLVDGMLRQSGIFRENQEVAERVMDSGAIERERGITILAKNTAVAWRGDKINIVDTPGHADFGGEVERALQMVDGVLLLVDAAEGPMPQTRFVLKKALALGLRPIVVVNKIDRADARPDEVVDLTFDLMVDLGASDAQLDFPVIHAIARDGRAWRDGEEPAGDLAPLFETILSHFPATTDDPDGPVLLQVANLDYDDYVGRLAIGRLRRGRLRPGDDLLRLARDGSELKSRVTKVYTHLGLGRVETEMALAGDIVVLSGVDGVQIGETLASPEHPERMPTTAIDEPTVAITLSPNTSPFAGRDGRYLTSRHIADRLERELLTNVALRVEPLGGESYRVSGRGELHLSILLEQMRREGYEFSVSRPEVILREQDGVTLEPVERVVADVPSETLGSIIEALNQRRGKLVDLQQGETRARAEFQMPSRGLFGFRTTFLSMTAGEGLLSHVFDGYEPLAGEIRTRATGSLVAMEPGETFAYSLFKLQDRGTFFIDPGTEVYVGMIIGANARSGDMDVNVTKNKKLTNVRASGSDDNIVLTPARKPTLEEALEYLGEDDLLEVTPKHLRLRKRTLEPNLRKREAKQRATA